MHEVAIVNDLFRIVLDVAEKEKLKKVDKVHFQLGKMMQVVPDLFKFAFDSAKADTLAAEAELEIEFLPVRMKCRQCGTEFELKQQNFQCPDCQGMDLDMVQGRELIVKSIEGE